MISNIINAIKAILILAGIVAAIVLGAFIGSFLLLIVGGIFIYLIIAEHTEVKKSRTTLPKSN